MTLTFFPLKPGRWIILSDSQIVLSDSQIFFTFPSAQFLERSEKTAYMAGIPSKVEDFFSVWFNVKLLISYEPSINSPAE